MFHKILKSGCKAEESKLRTAQRLTNLISLFCILSWRVFWMTMLNRSAPEAPPTLALTATEIGVLDRLVNDKPKAIKTLALSDQDRPARRLSRPRQRSAARQYGPVARAVTPSGCVIASQSRQLNFSRTVSITLKRRGISSSVEVTLSPSFDSRSDPQQGHCVGAGGITPSRSISSGRGWHTGRLRSNERTVCVLSAALSAASSSSVAPASSSSSSSSS